LRPPIGLFYATFATLDDDDEPGWVFGSLYLAWQEHKQLELTR
jgi:hypothetical protein